MLFCLFGFRFIELHTEEVKAYRMVQSTVISNIRLVCKTVNQTMLLNNLHDTRICDKLLEPESSDDVWKQTYSKSYAGNHCYIMLFSISLCPAFLIPLFNPKHLSSYRTELPISWLWLYDGPFHIYSILPDS